MSSSSIVWDAAAVKAGLDETSRLRPSLLAYLKFLLDDYHGVARPIEYYDLVAGMWLETLAHNIYTAWREVLITSTPAEIDAIPLIQCTKHANAMSTDLRWHRHLRAVVAKLLERQSSADWGVVQDQVHITSGQQNRSNSLLRRMSTNNPKVLLTYPGFKCSRPEWIGTLWGWRKWIRLDNMAYPVKVAAKADWVWRKKKSAEFYPHPKCFEEIVCALLPLYLPVILLEAFEDYRKAVLALPLPRPRILFSSNALHFNPTFQILMAEWRREGTHLLYHQHGGGYGLEPDMAVENYEIRVSDKFYSWGWQREGTAVLPLSPAMPEAKRNRLNGPVLLNCLDLPRAPYRLMFAPMPGTIDAMHRLTEDFLRGLPDVVKLTIRPYPVNYGWGAVERMYAAAPKARFDTSRVGLSRFFSASLVIHNYLGTSWLETLGFNIPTVCFFDPAIYIFRDNAQPYIDALRAVGVLHHSGADAARFVSGIAKDIGGWWQKPDVQQARFEFTQHYANFRPDWAMQWEAEFKKWLD